MSKKTIPEHTEVTCDSCQNLITGDVTNGRQAELIFEQIPPGAHSIHSSRFDLCDKCAVAIEEDILETLRGLREGNNG